MQADLTGIRQERAALEQSRKEILRQMQELEEIKYAVGKQESTREFVRILATAEEEMRVQAEAVHSMGRALEEILYCFERTENQIVQEYEQERVEVPRYPVNFEIIGQIPINITLRF